MQMKISRGKISLLPDTPQCRIIPENRVVALYLQSLPDVGFAAKLRKCKPSCKMQVALANCGNIKATTEGDGAEQINEYQAVMLASQTYIKHS